jgi:hypothetical protein
MADSSTPLDQVVAGSGAAARINELFDAASSAMVFARRAATCTGLTWGYYGGRWSGLSVANGTVALTASATNYVVVALATGVVSVSTATTNWNDTTNYARAYEIVAGGASVSSYEDHRAGSGGTINAAQTTTSVLGKHAIYVSAAAMQPSVTGGCASLTAIASASNQPDILTLDFDQTTQEFAQFGIAMPKSWNEGTLTAAFVWSHASGAATFGVVWGLQAVGVSDGDSIATAFGTGQQVADTGGTANVVYRTGATPAITVGGTPQAEDMVFFRAFRVPADASDTLDKDARLHGVVLYLTIDAGNDA